MYSVYFQWKCSKCDSYTGNKTYLETGPITVSLTQWNHFGWESMQQLLEKGTGYHWVTKQGIAIEKLKSCKEPNENPRE